MHATLLTAVKYAWFKNHDTHNHIFSNHPYHFVSQSGYLYFSEVQFTDDRTYYCVVTLDNPDYMVADSSLAPSKVSLGCKLQIRPGSKGFFCICVFFNLSPNDKCWTLPN